MNTKTVMKLTAEGHKIHRDRGTYTHAAFDNHLPPQTIITQDGEPIWVEAWDRALTVGDVLPERAAIAVGPDGELYQASEFKERYMQYLSGYGTGRDPMYEPIPNVRTYITTVLDPSKVDTENLGYTPVGFDPRENSTPNLTGLYGPDGTKFEDWAKRTGYQSAKSNDREVKAQQIVEMWNAGDITTEVKDRKLIELFGGQAVDIDVVEDSPDSEEVVEVIPEAKPVFEAGDEPEIKESSYIKVEKSSLPKHEFTFAPCGKEVKTRWLNQHLAKCGSLECVALRKEAKGE